MAAHGTVTPPFVAVVGEPRHLNGRATTAVAARPGRSLHLLDGAAQTGATAESGSCRVAIDGVLYNGDELRRELDTRGGGGAALIAAGYRRWGAGVVQRLRGVFALIVWDADHETLLAARDPLGVYPLFFAERDGAVYLSTSIDALVQHPRVEGGLNIEAIADHLAYRWHDPTETFFETVRRVPPGHALEVSNTGTKLYRYWNPAPPDAPVRWVERDELDRFDMLFEQAVARPLELGRPGIFLSGGLDSVSVAAVAADLTRRARAGDPLALSLAFPGVEANEETVQRGVAAQLGLRQVLLPFGDAVGPDGLLEAALAVSAASPAPLLNIWYPAYESLTIEGAREGCRVVLTGGGGDEWLSVSPFLAADLLRSGDVRGLFRLWRSMYRSYRLSKLATLRSVLWRFGARPLVVHAAERRAPRLLGSYRRRRRRQRFPDWVAPDSELRRSLEERAERAATAPAAQGFYLREGQLSLDHTLVSMEMEELHENGRRTGIPVRMPFWDADLVDFLYRTPPALLSEGQRSKRLVREMLARRFPDLGFERHKKVLATNFFRHVVQTEGPRVWDRLGGASFLAQAGVVDDSALKFYVQGTFSGTTHDLSRVWNVMSMEVWVRSHLGGGGR